MNPANVISVIVSLLVTSEWSRVVMFVTLGSFSKSTAESEFSLSVYRQQERISMDVAASTLLKDSKAGLTARGRPP